MNAKDICKDHAREMEEYWPLFRQTNEESLKAQRDYEAGAITKAEMELKMKAAKETSDHYRKMEIVDINLRRICGGE